MDKISYFKRVYPFAEKVEKSTEIPVELVTAWWSWETDFGSNRTSKVYNEAGITKESSGKDFILGAYAGYNSHENFIKDYIRIILLPDTWRGYKQIIQVAKANPSNYALITKAHNSSKWSEADYNVDTIATRAREIVSIMKR